MKKNRAFLPILLSIILLPAIFSCKQDPVLEIEDPISMPDSTMIDTDQEPTDTVEMNSGSTCDTTEVSFSAFIVPLIQENCIECHSGDEPRGGVHLNSHEGVKKVADEGRLYGAVAWLGGYEAMPQGRAKLPDCDISKIKVWIDAGTPND